MDATGDGGEVKYFLRPIHWGLKEWAVMATLVGITCMFDKVDDSVVSGSLIVACRYGTEMPEGL